MRTKYWIAALLMAALAASALLPAAYKPPKPDRLADETAQFTTKVGRPPSPTVKDTNSWTDLHYAAVLNLPSLEKRLLQAGSKVDARLKSDEKPFTDEWKATLRRFGKNYDNSNRSEDTPLHIAAWENARETTALLIEKGAAVNTKTNDGKTPLAVALRRDAYEATAVTRQHGRK